MRIYLDGHEGLHLPAWHDEVEWTKVKRKDKSIQEQIRQSMEVDAVYNAN